MWQSDPNFNVVLIVALVFSSLVAIPILVGSLIYKNTQKRREAELIKMAIEKGHPVPEFSAPQPSRFGTLKAALVWIAVGLGLMLMMFLEEVLNLPWISIGLIPLLVGIALLIGWGIEQKELARGKAGS